MSQTAPHKPVVPPRVADDGNPAFFDQPIIDRLIAVVLELGAELWIQRDRNRVLEAVLTDQGVLAPHAVEQHRLSAEAEAARKIDRDALAARLFSALTTTTEGTPK